MTDIFYKSDNTDVPEIVDDCNIIQLNFKPFLMELTTRSPKVLYTPALISFINTLGKNKSGSNNAIGRLQFFLNAYTQETALLKINSNRLSFISDDHDKLIRGNSGAPSADFAFTAPNGEKYSIDAKMYGTVDSYYKNWPTTNFHEADYCLIFTIKENLWLYSKKTEQYKNLYSVDKLIKTDPWLSEINLPRSSEFIRFDIDLSASDEQLPEVVSYKFYTKQCG